MPAPCQNGGIKLTPKEVSA
ncbi:uncharacterized protein FFB20_15911 [Fusarium fujikuroi]|nr:uncharacterized protein FFB20_15911 [Fusarium fujikuroi]